MTEAMILCGFSGCGREARYNTAKGLRCDFHAGWDSARAYVMREALLSLAAYCRAKGYELATVDFIEQVDPSLLEGGPPMDGSNEESQV